MELLKRINNNVLTIEMSGDIDEASIQKMKDAFVDVGLSEKIDEVNLDFSNLSFLDSTAIGVILTQYKRLNKLNIAITVSNMNKQIDKVFSTLGIYQIIKEKR